MGNQSFRFQRFTVCQDLCAMKVGTDGVLLGAWAELPAKEKPRLLDIGTGTGLLALMMAQRFPEARVTAIDIDSAAARQAAANFAASPFADRLEALCQPLQDFEAEAGAFDGIVCNPPFYVDALKCPDGRRSLARHADTLPFAFLVKSAARLLAADGRFSLVLPLGALKAVEAEAIFAGLSPSRRTLVRTTASKPPKRALVEFAKTYRGDVEQCEMVIGGETHARITRGFLLPKNL